MSRRLPPLVIIGDVGVDLVMGPVDGWPRLGTESVIDQSEVRAGGSAGNTALAMSYLGADSRLISAVGNDDFGRWLTGQFRGLKASLAVCDAPTTVTVGFIHPSSERTFFTSRGHLEKFAYEHVRPLLPPAQDPNSIAMLSGVFLTPEIRRCYDRLIEELAQLGYQIALDTGWPPGGWDDQARQDVSRWIAKCDHILLNELEVANFAAQEELGAAIQHISRTLKAGASLIVKTGPKGALGFQAGQRFESQGEVLEIFDTIGAGDSFNAAYLLGRLNGYDLPDSLAVGCEAAASIISRFPRSQIKPGELAGKIALAGMRLFAQR